jgi:hypothetical protein
MTTPIANIPEIAASQTNKYLIHNEALRHIEALAIAAVEGELTSPSTSATEGQTFIVGIGASGAWERQDNKIAQYSNNSWLFYPVFEGLVVANKVLQGFSYFDGTSWLDLATGGGGGANLAVIGGATTVSNVDQITFTGATVTNNGNGDTTVAIASSPTLTLIQGATTVTSVDQLSITGATLTNQGNGDALLAIPTSNLSITNGTSTVSNVDSINFSGATLTNQGSGDITIAIPTSNPLTVIGGATTVTSVDKITFTGATVTNDGNGDTTVGFAPPANLIVADGSTSISSVDKITFSGATVTNQGNGDVSVTVGSPLSVTNGTTTVSNTTSISFSNAGITNSGGGVATVTFSNSSTSFQSSTIISLPYTLVTTDQYKELVVINGAGNFSIPLTTTTFPVGWQCTLSLDGTGNINIQRSDNSYTNLVFSGGEPRLKTQGSVTLVHRGSNVWKVIGYLQA